MRFSLKWALAAMAYVALAVTAIGQGSLLCATVLFALVIVAFSCAIILGVFARGESRAKAFQWGAIGSLSLSFICLAYWFVTIFWHTADFELAYGGTQMSAANGSIVFCDNVANLYLIESVVNGNKMSPAPTIRRAWTLPGIWFRFITFFGRDEPVWAFRLSLLYPSALAALVAAYFIGKVRRLCKASWTPTPPGVTWPAGE